MFVAFMGHAESSGDMIAWGLALSLFFLPIALVIVICIHLFFKLIGHPIPTFSLAGLFAVNWVLFIMFYPSFDLLGRYANEAKIAFVTFMLLIDALIISFIRSGDVRLKSVSIIFAILALLTFTIGNWAGL